MTALLPQADQGGNAMKFFRCLALLSAILAALPTHAQISTFKHIVVIVQENRTPDNLFYELCNQPPASCSSTSQLGKFDILYPGAWNNQKALVTPQPIDLAIGWDIDHNHVPDWTAMCDQSTLTSPCQMDGAAKENCMPLRVQCPRTGDSNYPPELCAALLGRI